MFQLEGLKRLFIKIASLSCNEQNLQIENNLRVLLFAILIRKVLNILARIKYQIIKIIIV